MELQPGSLLIGKYVISACIGSGGMGNLYRALDQTLNRQVVLKFLARSHERERSFVRFQTEAKALSRLTHPNIAKVYDFGVLEDSSPYLVIEYIEGMDLQQIIDEHYREQNGSHLRDSWLDLSASNALQITIDLANALHHAHLEGVIHRDIKPSNIMLRPDGDEYVPVLLDFGIARINDDDDHRLTKPGEILGSPLYMSPEQAAGIECTAASDQYSLACVLYHMLVGSPPFVGDSTLQTLQMHKSQGMPPLKIAHLCQSNLAALEAVLARMLAKSPIDRYEDARQAGAALYAVREQIIESETKSVLKMHGEDAKPHASQAKKLSARTMCLLAGIIIASLAAVSLAIKHAATAPPALKVDPKKGVESDLIFTGEPARERVRHLENLMKSSETTIKLKGQRYRDDDLKCLQGYTLAHHVDLSYNDITDEGTKYLVDMPLRDLSVSNTNVVDLSYIGRIKCLFALNVSGCKLKNESFRNLKNLHNLRYLRVQDIQATAEDLEPLKKLATLVSVDAQDSLLSDEDLRKFSDDMPGCSFNGRPCKLQSLKDEQKQLSKQPGCDREVERLVRRIMSIIEKAQGLRAPALADSYRDLAFICHGRKQSWQANQYLAQAESISREYGDLHSLASTCHYKHSFLFAQGLIEPALKAADEEAALRESMGDDESFDFAEASTRAGGMAIQLHDYEGALHRLARALPIAERGTHDEANADLWYNQYAIALEYAGSAEQGLKHQERSLSFLKKAEEAFDKAPDNLDRQLNLRDVHAGISQALENLGRYEESAAERRIAIQLAHSTGSKEAERLNQLALDRVLKTLASNKRSE